MMKKKSVLIGIISASVALGISYPQIVKARTNAANMYVNPVSAPKTDIMTVDWSPVKNPFYTYWAVHNWQGNCGGYAGFQQQNGRRTAHFSIWDPPKNLTNESIKAEYLSPNSKASRFGGEGEGMAVSTSYDWQVNGWYKMTMRSWQEDGHTKYGQWVRDESNKQWKQIAILDYPVANTSFNNCGMFQEDWAGNGQDQREARLKNFYNRNINNKAWVSLNKQRVTTSNAEQNWNGGSTSDYIWVSAGGNVKPTMTNGQVYTINQPSIPDMGTLDFDITNAKYQNNSLNISWKLKDKSSPQFKGKVEIYNNASMTGTPIKTIDNIKSYKNTISENCQLNSSTGLYAKIIITDLFDNIVTKKVNLTGQTENPYLGKNFNFSLKGAEEWLFAEVNLDLNLKEAKVDIKNGDAHYLVKDNYASIIIRDEKGNVIYSKDFIGNAVNDTLVKSIPIKSGYFITIKHKEANLNNRLSITNLGNIAELDKDTNITYKITDTGLLKSSESEITNPNKSPYIGKEFNFSLKGAEEWLFAELKLDLNSNQATIDIKNGDAHYLVKDNYASIIIRDEKGNVIYSKDFIGNAVNDTLVKNIPLKPGYFITIKHKEANFNNRLSITNLENKLELEKDTNITYKITDTGLIKVSGDEIIKLPLKSLVNFDDTEVITGDLEITGECVSGKKIANIQIDIDNTKYTNATFSKLDDSQNKYLGYDLSNAAFRIKLSYSNINNGSHSYKIIATTEDGEKTTLKQGSFTIKKETSGGGSEQTNQWKPGVSYKIGDVVEYNGINYKCIQAHKSIRSWEPSVAISLWSKVIKR